MTNTPSTHSPSLYDFSGRVVYSDFVSAAEKTMRAILARTQSGRYHLKITPTGGESAYVSTSGAQTFDVGLPSIPMDTVITAEYARRLLAFLIHELCHVLATDLGLLGDFHRRTFPLGVTTQLAAELLNQVEDYYIERVASDPRGPVVQNAPALLGYLNDVVQQPGGALAAIQATPAARHDPFREAQWLLCALINRHGCQITPALDQYAADTQQAATPAVMVAVREALTALDICADKLGPITPRDQHRAQSVDRHNITFRLIEALAKANKPKDKDKPKDNNKPKDEDKGKGKPGEGDKPREGQPGEGQPGEGDKPGEGAGLAGPSPQAKQTALAAVAPNLTRQQRAQGASTTMGSATLADPANVASFRRKTWITTENNGEAYAETTRRVAAAVDARATADAFRRGLQSVEKIVTQRRLQSGRLDRRGLMRAATGAKDVFSRSTITPGVDTAVLVMVDASGSMGNVEILRTPDGEMYASRWQAVIGVLAVILPALDRARAQTAAFGWTGGIPRRSDDERATIFPLKPWHQRPRTVDLLDALGRQRGHGGTPMAKEVRWAQEDIKSRRADRRVVLWLHDGTPNDGDGTREALRIARAQGVEHYGIGIATSARKTFGWRYSADVDDLGKLPKVLETILLQGVRT